MLVRRIPVFFFFLFCVFSGTAWGQSVPGCKADQLSGPPAAETVTTFLEAENHQLAVFYVIPFDMEYEQAVYDRLVTATRDIQAWYQCATGGLTWEFAFPEIVRVYYGAQTRDYYRTHGDWWGSLLGEMGSSGLPIWSPGFVTAVWARGAGWWAGGAQWCSGSCGTVILGVELIPEFNNPGWSGGECPTNGYAGNWPCTPEGGYAHELGHTLGLPHPYDFPETNAVAFHSIMQSHWNYPDLASGSDLPWGFLTLERLTCAANSFMHKNIELLQNHPDCDVVNLPDTGAIPMIDFAFQASAFNVATENATQGAVLHYWTFGDGAVSNELNPVHTYDKAGTYALSLRATGANAMMAREVKNIVIAACHDFNPRVKITNRVAPGDDSFLVKGTLVLDASNEMNVTGEDLALRIGSYQLIIPAGSFQPVSPKTFAFTGTIEGAQVQARLRGLSEKQYALSLKARGVELPAIQYPADIRIVIGNDSWCGEVSP